MNNQLSVFNFQNHSVRVEVKDNEPLFCLKDVAEILEISNAKTSRFNLNEAGVHIVYLRSSGQNRELTFINEPNLYRLIFKSRKPEAVKFQDWIFEEVIPAIRKTGCYQKPTEPAIPYEPKRYEVGDDTLYTLFSFIFLAHSQAVILKELYPALTQMMSKLHPEVYSLYSETSLAITVSRRSLEEELFKLAQSSRKWKQILNEFKDLQPINKSEPQTASLKAA